MTLWPWPALACVVSAGRSCRRIVCACCPSWPATAPPLLTACTNKPSASWGESHSITLSPLYCAWLHFTSHWTTLLALEAYTASCARNLKLGPCWTTSNFFCCWSFLLYLYATCFLLVPLTVSPNNLCQSRQVLSFWLSHQTTWVSYTQSCLNDCPTKQPVSVMPSAVPLTVPPNNLCQSHQVLSHQTTCVSHTQSCLADRPTKQPVSVTPSAVPLTVPPNNLCLSHPILSLWLSHQTTCVSHTQYCPSVPPNNLCQSHQVLTLCPTKPVSVRPSTIPLTVPPNNLGQSCQVLSLLLSHQKLCWYSGLHINIIMLVFCFWAH